MKLLQSSPYGPCWHGLLTSPARFIFSHHVGTFQYLRLGDFSLRTWLKSGKGNLFITWREDTLTTLRALVSTLTDILITCILALPNDEPPLFWLVLDELASLERLTSLEARLTKGQKYGLRVVAGLQSISQLNALYGVHNARTLRSFFRRVLALGCSNADLATAKVVSDGLGQREVQRRQTSHSDSKTNGSTSTTWQHSAEAAVLAYELMALPALRGFLKPAADYPIGKVRLIHKVSPVRVKPLVER